MGIENSVACFHNFVFFTDNGGRLQCVDLNTLKLQYVVDVTDDSDTSIVIEEDVANNTFYLYTANEWISKAARRNPARARATTRKIDGAPVRSYGEGVGRQLRRHIQQRGTLTTPHVGHGNISDL